MKQVIISKLWSWWLVGMMMVFTAMAKPATIISEPSDRNSTQMSFYCSQYKGINQDYFLSNLNATLSSLHRQLSIDHAYYAVARTLWNGESVWGLATCRRYVSNVDCVACFDDAVAHLKVCGLGNGAQVSYSDCDLRYENYNFYTETHVSAGMLNCNNKTSPKPKEFKRTAEWLLSDLRIVAPRTSAFYAASTRRISGGNETIYAFAQCNLNISQSDCLQCLSSRYTFLDGCLPSTSGETSERGCHMRYSGTPFFGQDQITDIESLLWDGDSRKKISIIGGVVGGVSFLLVVFAFIFWRYKPKDTYRDQQNKSTGSIDLLQGPMAYRYDDLKLATNNFSDEFKLGGGVFTETYKGALKNGDMVAIKKTVMVSGKRKTQFHDELKIISNVQHRHLIRLLGYCSKGPFIFLVHEYMENGSLDQFLYGDGTKNLNWKQRFEIIYGIARGLAYLHEQYHVTIIHRDIKSKNIMLDREFQPKIADFGLIRLLPEDKTHLSTEFLNSGYVAPEYAIHGQLSEKVDTYSFGILVLEIISGKRYTDVANDKSVGTQNLLDHAWNLYNSGTHLELMDDKLDPSEYAAEDAMKIIKIALMCTQSYDTSRPSMSEVVAFLSDKYLDERPTTSTNTNDEVKVDVVTMESLTSNATTSTNQLSGRS